MKKTILLSTAFLIYTLCCSQSYFSAGIGSDINIGKSSRNYNSTTTLGSFIEFNFHQPYKKILFRPGIQTKIIHWKHKRAGLVSTPEAPLKSRLLYFSVLPQAEWRITPNFSFGGGGFYRFLILEQFHSPFSNSWQSSDTNIYENNDFGIHFTSNVYLKNFALGINYLHGLKAINSANLTDPDGNLLAALNAKNRVVQIRLLYFFV